MGGFDPLFDFNLKLDHLLANLFIRWTTYLATRPKRVMFLSSLVLISLGFGIVTNGVSESSISALWVPQDSEAARDRVIYREQFPVYNDVRYSTIMINAKGETDVDGDGVGDADIARYEPLLEMIDFYHKVLNITAMWNGTVQNFSQLCYKPDPLNPDDCALESVLDAWSYVDNGPDDVNKYRIDEDLLLADYLSAPNHQGIKARLNGRFESERGSRVGIEPLIGGFERSAGQLLYVTAFRFGIIFRRGDDESPWGEAMDSFEFSVRDMTAKQEYDHILVDFLGFRSLTDELARSVSGDVVLWGIGYILMVVFCCSALGKMDCVKSKKMLGGMGVLSVIFAVWGGIGLSCFMGVPITPITQIVPFLALGIGVDDMFIMVNSLSKTDRSQPIEKRIVVAVSRAGVSITITSLTDFLAFIVGSTSRLPAIRYFCVNLALCVLFDFFMQITFFAAYMVIDGRREERGIIDCCCFPVCAINKKVEPEDLVEQKGTHSPHEENDNSLLGLFFRNVMAPLLRSKVYRVFVTLFFIVLSIMGGIFGVQVESRFEIYDILTDDSPLIAFFDRYYIKFTHLGAGIDIIVNEPDFDYVTNREGLRTMLQGIEKAPYVELGFSFWLDDFQEFQQCSPCCQSDAVYTLHGPSGIPLPVFEGDSTECTPAYLDLLTAQDGTGFAKDMESFNLLLYHFIHDEFYGPTSLPDLALIPECSSFASMTVEEWTEKGCSLMASQFDLRHYGSLNIESTSVRVTAMKGTRTEFAKYGFKGFAYCGDYLFWEQYDILDDEAGQNLAVALIAVIFVCFFFLIHPGMSLCMAICIAGIDLGIVGGMFLSNVYINVISVANLVLAIGLSVDYCSHIAHAFIVMQDTDADGNDVTSLDRSINALIHIGPSVVSGGFTTFLGIACLAFSKSNVFRIFFKMFCLIIGLGLAYGVFVIPVLLTWLDLRIPKKNQIQLQQKLKMEAGAEHGEKVKGNLNNRWEKRRASSIMVVKESPPTPVEGE